ncbi:NAD(P)H-dependent oxidoreductase [Chryseobacterium gambrini]|uniref:NAD(P)H-dependent oxidoreductase n=1 Tax=Chryseobacterium gambrini TaxID=373672 RepID=A0AAJ1R9R7_9FLAO|nr:MULTISPECIES: NAD(P)H-dependent oxidoreductase [Chryseobacterium]MDN4014078.1 NAD(P)H-dependent oxidoreductase [Chryseobacterium gambrini]MDN4028131.1 NAD(P)H-dependent oxidoreductase [Chryseobacterium gambrini]QWA39845.1 NAD(P)H-dependent oxidoreductase [Chryseobacterium sp. ZHDP1]
MKKILIINGHPNKDSFNFGIAKAYQDGALQSGAEVKEIVIADLNFNPNLQFGYQKRMELEPDLVKAWEKIQWADHLVWIHPVWWGGLPAITKGFIDRLFLPGFAFKYRENSVWWDKLLKGETAHIITTLDQPGLYYRFFFGRPSVNQLRKSVLEFCGVKPVNVTYIGIIKTSDIKQRKIWLEQIRLLAKKQK